MDYRRKYLRFKGNDNKISQTEKKIIPSEREEKPKMDKSYLQKLIQNSNNISQTGTINLKSYNENLPSFRISIRDILSTEENKQKAINYVIQKRNEDKYGRKNNLNINKEENTNNNLLNKYNKNNIYNSNSKILTKNNTVYNTNRTNIINNINQKLNNENNINISKSNYSYYIEKTNKPYISSTTSNNNLIDNYGTNNNSRNNYINKSTTKTNLNENNIGGRSYVLRTDLNNNNNINNYKYYKTNVSPNISHNNNISNNTTSEKPFKKVRKYEIIRSNKPNREPQNLNQKTERVIQETVTTIEKPSYTHIGTYLKNKENNNKVIINKIDPNNISDVSKKSYEILPVNLKQNVSIYYSRYSKKNDNESKNKENEYRIYQKMPKFMFRDYKNFKISKNNFQLNTKKDNQFKFRNDKIKKNKIIKEKNIEINISGLNANIIKDKENLKFVKKYGKNKNELLFKDENIEINISGLNANIIKDTANIKSVKKYGKNKNELLFKDENELIDYINKKYENNKKIEVFKIEKEEKFDKNEKNDELEKTKEKLNDEINKRK